MNLISPKTLAFNVISKGLLTTHLTYKPFKGDFVFKMVIKASCQCRLLYMFRGINWKCCEIPAEVTLKAKELEQYRQNQCFKFNMAINTSRHLVFTCKHHKPIYLVNSFID